MYRRILKDTELESEIPLLDILRHIRNGQHNNGVFLPSDGEDETISYAGKVFTFEAGKVIGTIDPFRAAWIVDAVSVAMATMINSKPVASLDRCIPSEHILEG